MRSIFPFGFGLVLAVSLIPWVRKFSLRFGYLDLPGEDPLKVHYSAIPYSGGIAFFGIFSLFVVTALSTNIASRSDMMGLLLGGGLVFGLGVWDDFQSLPPKVRLVGQILAGVILFLLGSGIETALLISLPLTVFYVVGATNALNMEDGLDGLAGGMALFSFLGFALLGALKGQAMGLMVSSLMAGVLLGFLFYNFNPASIFMGDNGSYFLGFLLAYLAIKFTSFDHLSTFLGPILMIGAPVFDTAYAILRRLKRGVSPFSGDRSHFYDQLRQRGLTVRFTVLICWAIQAALVGLGVAVYLL